MPRCNRCDAYYVRSFLGCPHCSFNFIIDMKNPSTNQISTLRDNLFGNDENLINADNNINGNLNPPVPNIEQEVIPPPVPELEPRRFFVNPEHISLENQQLNYFLVRRLPILVFDDTLDLLLQYSWIHRHGADLEVQIKREQTREENDFPLKLLIKFRIINFANLEKPTLDNMLSNLSLNEEMSILLASHFLVLSRNNLPQEIISYLHSPWQNQSSRSRPVFVLDNFENSHPQENTYNITDAENLIISLTKSILGISPNNTNINYTILSSVTIIESDYQQHLVELDSNVVINSAYNIQIESSEAISCVAHGGIIDSHDKTHQCLDCGNYLCDYCSGFFVICPGSFVSFQHKFQK